MRRWLMRLGVLVVLVGTVLVLKWTVFATGPIAVQVIEVERGLVESTVTNSRAGAVRARRRAGLSPETSGRVVELPYAVGARVVAGDVLLRMDSSSQTAQVELARRALESALAAHGETCLRASRAERQLERNHKLADKGHISTDLLDGFASAHEVAVAACATADARVAQARAELLLVETELRKTEVQAPFDGVIAEREVELGEWITPSPPGVMIPSIIDLIDPTSIYISAPMDEVDSTSIRLGQAVRVTLDPHPGRSFVGKVSRIAPYVLDVEEQNRTVEIEVELEDEAFAAAQLPGTSADVEVILETVQDALRVPTSAFLEGGRVLVLDKGVLVERSVEAGLKNWDWTEVRAGLEAGERVVTSLGSADVEAGAEASIIEDKPEGTFEGR